MKFFVKLNIISILYALMIVVPFELMLNVYRISRVTSLNIGTVNMLIGIAVIVGFIFGTILLCFLTKKWRRKANYWTVILWVPYFVLFVYIFVTLFPITYGGDEPNPVTGLLAIAALIVFPIYILIVNFIGFIDDDETMKPV
ncbi:hypothetical protein ACW2QC_04410 [Virgibacillus sp. FSP13]